MSKSQVYIGFTSSPGWLSRLIREFEHADVSHTFLAWPDPNFDVWMTLGAEPNGVIQQPLSRFTKEDNPELWLLSGPDLWPGIITLLDVINTPYGYATLLGMSVVEAEEHLFHRAGDNPIKRGSVICSEYVSLVLRMSGYQVCPDKSPESIDPGDIKSWLINVAKATQTNIN